jgi:hypothetical protein
LSDEPLVDMTGFDWSDVRAVAERHHLMVRLRESFERRGIPVSDRFEEAARRQQRRAKRIHALAQQIGEACERLEVRHAFLKLGERHPDAGRDIDVLIGSRDPNIDAQLLDRIPAIARTRRLDHRLAGTSLFTVPTYDTEIDVHHRRLGRLGEHTREADLLLRRRRVITLGSAAFYVPSREDELLLRALTQFARLPCLRLSDVHETIRVVKSGTLDWHTIVAEADATGLLPSLSCHLHYVDEIHRQVFERPLLDELIRGLLLHGSWGPVVWRNGGYRFSAARVSGPIQVQQLRTHARRGDWSATGRTLLLPLVAAAAAWRRFKRRWSQRS